MNNIHTLAKYIGIEIGKETSKLILESAEEQSPIVIYPGRFQPPHPGHLQVYNNLVKQFGKDNVYIATSDKYDPDKSPLSFNDKQEIWSDIFGIPVDKIIQVKNPYTPTEIVSQFDESRPLIVAVSEKDSNRIKSVGKYYSDYNADISMKGYKDAGYVYLVPTVKHNNSNLSATQIRDIMNSDKSDDEKENELKSIYQSYTSNIFPKLKSTIKKFDHSKLNDKILNPETNKKILVRSALTYDKSHPVYKSARKLLQLEIIQEGGAAGHISHPYENLDLTFRQFKDMLRQGIEGKLNTTEKLDGINISFTVVDGEVKFARNKGQMKHFGKSALSSHELGELFKDRPQLYKIFSLATKNIEQYIKLSTSQDLNDIFDNGKQFMSTEIIHPSVRNIIPYQTPALIFHGTFEVDENGNKMSKLNPQSARQLSTLVRDIESEFNISGPRPLIFDSNNESVQVLDKALSDIDKIKESVGLNDDSKLSEYHLSRWKNIINKTSASRSIQFSPEEFDGLLKRWALGDKSFKKSNFEENHIDNEKFAIFTKLENNQKLINNKINEPFEKAVLKIGTEVIKQYGRSLLAADPKESDIIKNAISNMIKIINSEDDTDVQLKLKRQLKRLNSLGGLKAVQATEGLVFIYGDNVYKWTGAFAPVNQILGLKGFEEKQKAIATASIAMPVTPSRRQNKYQDIINKETIRNPETDNDILIKTALQYGKSHPAYKLAIAKLKSYKL